MKNKIVFAIFSVVFVFLCFNFAFFNTINNFAVADNTGSTCAKSMLVLEGFSGRVLYNKNEHERLPMASLTKIITAIYVIEHCSNLDEVYEIPKCAIGVEGSSLFLKNNEHMSVRDLLFGLMLRSGNDCAVALATIVSGDENTFVCNVNAWLNSLGYKNTNLVNPHGLHNDNHYTTAYELAKITQYALRNETFKEIVSSKEKVISGELTKAKQRKIKNKNKFLNQFEFADGVKTGFTKKAGRCFVGSSTKDNMQIICVLLNCVPMFDECLSLTKSAFCEYSMQKIVSKGEILKEKSVFNNKKLKYVINKDFYYPLKEGEFKDIKLTLNEKEFNSKIKTNDHIGDVEITFQNQLIFSDKIYSINYIKDDSLKAKLSQVIRKM